MLSLSLSLRIEIKNKDFLMRMHSRSPQSQLQRRPSRSCEDIKGIITHKSKHTQHKNETTHKKSLVIVQPPSLSRLSLY